VGLSIGRELGPAASGRAVEDADVSAGQELEGVLDGLLAIKLGASCLTERLEPGRVHEVGHQDAADLVGELVGLAGVTDLVRIQPHPAVRLIDVGRQVDVRVGQHLEKLVAGGDRPLAPELEVGACEHLAQRQTLVGQVVVAEGARLVRIVEDGEPPGTHRRVRAPGDEDEIGIDAPGWSEVVMDLSLERRDGLAHIGVLENGTGVDDGDLDSGHSASSMVRI
jgi:hypothetical protein